MRPLPPSSPHHLDAEKLVQVITAKGPWLQAKLMDRARTAVPRAPREYVSGEGFPYLGRSYRLQAVDELPENVRLMRGRVQLRGDGVNDAARHLVHWYRKTGEPWLARRIVPWAQRMEVEVVALRVLPLGFRWGSCTADGKVNIHWATMQLPPDLIDYVLVHELAHVRHHDHGGDFWRAVDRAMPGWEGRRAHLKQAGPDLWLPS